MLLVGSGQGHKLGLAGMERDLSVLCNYILAGPDLGLVGLVKGLFGLG